MTKVKVEAMKNPDFRHIFLIEPPDEERYRIVQVMKDGLFWHYGDWNTQTHPTFQSWMDYLFRPGTVKVTEEIES